VTTGILESPVVCSVQVIKCLRKNIDWELEHMACSLQSEPDDTEELWNSFVCPIKL